MVNNQISNLIFNALNIPDLVYEAGPDWWRFKHYVVGGVMRGYIMIVQAYDWQNFSDIQININLNDPNSNNHIVAFFNKLL